MDWLQVRAGFPALTQWTYLDTATFGQLPRLASQAVIDHLSHRDQTANTRFLNWFDDMDRIRQSCAQLINASAANIAFVPSASAGLACLIQGLDWQPGDEVLTVADEFPNQLYQGPAARKAGATFRAVPWPNLYSSITPKTRVVLLSTVNYATGFRAPVEEISRFLRERGILLYLDGTQSIGALQFDVQTVRPAMLCVDAYKWLLSPNGAGFIYVDPFLRPSLAPSVVGWRTDAGWRQVSSLNQGDPVFSHSAERYEGGMIPFPSLYAMGAVLDFVLELGPAAIEARVLDLAGQIRSSLTALGADVNQDASQIVTAKLPDADPNQVAQALKAKQIIVSARHGRLRISPHFYNTEADIEQLTKSLDTCL